MNKSVYIATSLSNVEGQRKLAKRLAEHGIVQSFDWTNIPGWPPGSAAGNVLAMMEIARQELRGVRRASLVIVLLTESNAQRGTHTELGCALALGIPVVIVGTKQQFDEVAFYHHPGVWIRQLVTEEGWEDYVVGYAKGIQ